MKHITSTIFLLCLLFAGFATPCSAQQQGFNLIVDEYRASSDLPVMVLITGDVVWDNMAFLPRVKQLFEGLDAELITVIGNHDHNRDVKGNKHLKELDYEEVFGARYKRFRVADTHFILLDNIHYRGYEDYSIKLDSKQRKWLRSVAKNIAKNERIAICMHAPAYDYRKGGIKAYARQIIAMFEGHEVHFITGHRHRHATTELGKNVIEHNVAQVNGNLWFAPICTDGTPPGVLCIEERNNQWQWHFRTFDTEESKLRIWHEGEVKDNEEYIVVKVIGWDDKHSVEWRENGVQMGAMEQITILDPDYIYYIENEADYNDVIMSRLRRSAGAHNHYFRCKRTSPDSEITISVTDRFGREYEFKMR